MLADQVEPGIVMNRNARGLFRASFEVLVRNVLF